MIYLAVFAGSYESSVPLKGTSLSLFSHFFVAMWSCSRQTMFFIDDPAFIAREKEKARELRRTRWWQTKIQQAKCYYCQGSLDSSTATMDHIVPISRGGRSVRGNVVPACKECNTQKRYLTPVEWLDYLTKLQSSQKSSTDNSTKSSEPPENQDTQEEDEANSR